MLNIKINHRNIKIEVKIKEKSIFTMDFVYGTFMGNLFWL